MGAFWELYAFTLFQRVGCTVHVDPRLTNSTSRPDLLVERDGARAYVECVVLFDDKRDHRTDGEQWLCECVNGAQNPDFMVDLDILRAGTQRPGKRKITQPIERRLASLDYEESCGILRSSRELPSRDFTLPHGWVLHLTAVPVNPDHRGEPGRRISRYPMNDVFVITSVDDLRDRLRRKAKQCQGTDEPLIVAILNYSTFADIDEVNNALFGDVGIRYYRHHRRSVQTVRLRDGFWDPGPPRRGSGISAVLFSNISPAHVDHHLPDMWINPWTDNPVMLELPFTTHTAHDSGEVLVLKDATKTPESVFGLPQGWPFDSD